MMRHQLPYTAASYDLKTSRSYLYGEALARACQESLMCGRSYIVMPNGFDDLGIDDRVRGFNYAQDWLKREREALTSLIKDGGRLVRQRCLSCGAPRAPSPSCSYCGTHFFFERT